MYYYDNYWTQNKWTKKGYVPENPKKGDVCSPIKIDWDSRKSNQAIMLIDNNHLTHVAKESKALDKGDEYMLVAVTSDITIMTPDWNKIVISRPLAYILPSQLRASGARVEYEKKDMEEWQKLGDRFRKIFAEIEPPKNEEEEKALQQYLNYKNEMNYLIYSYIVQSFYKEEFDYKLENKEETIKDYKEYLKSLLKDITPNDLEKPLEELLELDLPDDILVNEIRSQFKLLNEDFEKWLTYDLLISRKGTVLNGYGMYKEEEIEEFFKNPYICPATGEKIPIAINWDISYNFTGHRHPGSTEEFPVGNGFSGDPELGNTGDFLIRWKETWDGTKWEATPEQERTNETGICYSVGEAADKTEGTIQDSLYFPAIMFQPIVGSEGKIAVQDFHFSEYISYPKDYKGRIYKTFGTTLYVIGNEVEQPQVTVSQKFLKIEPEVAEQEYFVQTTCDGVETELSKEVFELFVNTPIDVLYDIDSTRFRYSTVVYNSLNKTRRVTKSLTAKKEEVKKYDKDYKAEYPKLKKLKEFLRKNNIHAKGNSQATAEIAFDNYVCKELFPTFKVRPATELRIKLFKVLAIWGINYIQFINEWNKGKYPKEVIEGFINFKDVPLPTFHKAKLVGIKWTELVLGDPAKVEDTISKVSKESRTYFPLTEKKCREALESFSPEYQYMESTTIGWIETFKDELILVSQLARNFEEDFWENAEKMDLDVYSLLNSNTDIYTLPWEVAAWDFEYAPNKYLLENNDMYELLTSSDLKRHLEEFKVHVHTKTKVEDKIFLYDKVPVTDRNLHNTLSVTYPITTKNFTAPEEDIQNLLKGLAEWRCGSLVPETAYKGLVRLFNLGVDFNIVIDKLLKFEDQILNIGSLNSTQYLKLQRAYQYTKELDVLDSLIKFATQPEKSDKSEDDGHLKFDIFKLKNLIEVPYLEAKEILEEFEVETITGTQGEKIKVNTFNYKEALTTFILESVLYIYEESEALNVIKQINTLKLDLSSLVSLNLKRGTMLGEILATSYEIDKLPMRANGMYYLWNDTHYISTTPSSFREAVNSFCKIEEKVPLNSTYTILQLSGGVVKVKNGESYEVGEVWNP